ncbi:class I SAM-dependent DNA methyltransferase [Hymenobacter sp. HDW8]|uniref:class I SAM-dependent DNA methyltransferase n=1 Tax=Hymenobacter sp. HDW8 TaxID=2714932 RepID=UPI00140D2FEA|nr:class I SAM-dependent methyltransferase [Hymenobacter sp. HDW8]QIL76401.1 class I SAM-dependent methyltransferase [Hymenobacter sp. HDW8]
MFDKTADYYDALYHFKDYGVACDKLHKLIQSQLPAAKSLLDIACGTGKHLEYLSSHYYVEGLDLNPDLLNVAQKRCPNVLFHQADMTDFSLSKTYDVVVCLFSSIAYVRTLENLRKAVQCMADHLSPNGLLVIEPWFSPDTYWVGKTTANFVDQPDLKIAWMYKSERKDLTSFLDIHYMVGTPQGIHEFTEEHILGLWTDSEYKQAFEDAGVRVNYDEMGLFGRGMYYGLKR